MTWNLKGSYAETCSCDLECPCNLSMTLPANHDYCKAALAFGIREGRIDGTDVSGLKVVAIVHTPQVMASGNWKLGFFIDEKASDEQFDKLLQVFGGKLGGPMAGVAPLVTEMLGVERAAIDIQHDGLLHSVRAGDAISFTVEDIVPAGSPTGKPVKLVGMAHPAVSAKGEMTLAQAKRSRINAFGIQYEGRTGLSNSEFSWAA